MKLPERYPNILLDAFQIMPNHIHGIIILPPVGATLAVARDANNTVARDASNAILTIGGIVGAYKSLVVNKCLEICKLRNRYMGKLWQRNYYEHIIRNEISHERIAGYIVNNMLNWRNDLFYT